MRCPKCDKEIVRSKAKVVDVRATNRGITRRRQCECGHRFSTVEVLSDAPFLQILPQIIDIRSALLNHVGRLRTTVARLGTLQQKLEQEQTPCTDSTRSSEIVQSLSEFAGLLSKRSGTSENGDTPETGTSGGPPSP